VEISYTPGTLADNPHVPPPTTENGKIRHARLRELLAAGALGAA
jgi:hypothetical protein